MMVVVYRSEGGRMGSLRTEDEGMLGAPRFFSLDTAPSGMPFVAFHSAWSNSALTAGTCPAGRAQRAANANFHRLAR